MKLFDIKKQADEKAAKDLAERQHQELMRELDIHPLVKLGLDRSARDSYFSGIAFAALADDLTVDKVELKLLSRIGKSLDIPESDCIEIIANVDATIKEAVDKDGQHVFDLLDAVATGLKDDTAFKLFVAEFIKIFATKSFETEQVKETIASHVASNSGHDASDVPFDALCRLLGSGRDDINGDDLLCVNGWLGNDGCRYFMLDIMEDDVRPLLESSIAKKLAAIIESEGTWPTKFDTAKYRSLFVAVGIPESDEKTFLAKMLLPYMRNAYEAAKAVIDSVRIVSTTGLSLPGSVMVEGYCYHGHCCYKFNNLKFLTLFRYASLFDAYLDLVTLSPDYYFCGKNTSGSEIDYMCWKSKSDLTYKRYVNKYGKPKDNGGVTLDRCVNFCGLEAGLRRMRKLYFAQWERLLKVIQDFGAGRLVEDSSTAN